jgi:hypothetical protein
MAKKAKGKNNESVEKLFVENKIGKRPTVNAESNEAFLLFVTLFEIRKTIIVNEAKRRLGIIFATISNGKKNEKNAIT